MNDTRFEQKAPEARAVARDPRLAEGRATYGSRAASAELRSVGVGAFSQVLSQSTHADGCASCGPGSGAKTDAGRQGAKGAPERDESAESAAQEAVAVVSEAIDGKSSKSPPGELRKAEEDAKKEIEKAQPQAAAPDQAGGGAGGGPDAGAAPGAGAGPGAGASPAAPASANARSSRKASAQAIQSARASFKPSGALGAMMHAHSHGGHSLDSCAFGHAGTNSWAKPSGFPGTLGLTTVRNAFSGPQLDFDVKSRPVAAPPATGGGAAPATPAAPPANEFVVKIKPTTSTDAVHPCVSSPAGDHSTGTMSIDIGGTPTNFDVFLKITPAFAQKIWNAEDEHLADALRAYNISLKEAESKVNTIAASNREFTGATEDVAKNAAKDALRATMPAKLGIDPANWRSAVWQLCLLTISQRDDLGYHTFGIAFDTVDIATHKVFNKLTDNTTQIGVHSSTSVVDLARLP